MCSFKSQEVLAHITAALERSSVSETTLRVLCIAPRVQFVETCQALLGPLGFRSYNDPCFSWNRRLPSFASSDHSQSSLEQPPEEWIDIKAQPLLICELESLHRLEGADNYDIVISDESESTLKSATEPTTNRGNLLTNWAAMVGFMQQSRQTIWLDADLGPKTMAFARATFKDEEIELWDNQRQVLQRMVFYYSLLGAWEKELLLRVAQGKNIGIVLGSREHGVELRKRLIALGVRDEDIKFYHKRHDDAQMRDFLTKDLEAWRVRVVMITPIVTVGASCNLVNHFDSLFVYATPFSVVPRDILQMCGRFRNLITNEIHLHINRKGPAKPNDRLPATLDGVKQHLAARRHLLNTQMAKVDKLDAGARQGGVTQTKTILDVVLDRSTNRFRLAPTAFNEVLAYNHLEENLAKNNYWGEMLPQLMRLGYRVFEGSSYRNNRPGVMASAAQNGDAVQPVPLSEADAFNSLELPEVGSGEWRRSYEELSRAVRQRRADEFDKIALIKMQHQARFKSVIDHAHYFANKGRMVQIQNAAAYKQVNSVATARRLLSRLQQWDEKTCGEQSAEVARPVLPGHLLAEELFNALHLALFDTTTMISSTFLISNHDKIMRIVDKYCLDKQLTGKPTRADGAHIVEGVNYKQLLARVNQVLRHFYGGGLQAVGKPKQTRGPANAKGKRASVQVYALALRFPDGYLDVVDDFVEMD